MANRDDNSEPRLRSHMLTDVGIVRDHNEDAAYIDADSDFFIVADGMGGHAAGEVASAMAVDAVRRELEEARPQIRAFADAPSDARRKELVSVLENAVRTAHQAVYERGVAETDKQGMGTTLDVVMLAGPEAFVAHVGDSRTYLMREGKAAQITTDHTVAEVLVIEGKLSAEEAQISPLRTILVNAIGVAPDVGVEMAHVRMRTGDQLLLCSDGLHDYFPLEQELADQMGDAPPDKSLSAMVELAKTRGGHDNITGIVVEMLRVVDPMPDADTVDTDGPGISGDDDTMADGVPAQVAREDTQPVSPVDLDELEKDRESSEPDTGEPDTVEVSPERSAPASSKAKAKAKGKSKSKSKPSPGNPDLEQTARMRPLKADQPIHPNDDTPTAGVQIVPRAAPSGDDKASDDKAPAKKKKRRRRRRSKSKKKSEASDQS